MEKITKQILVECIEKHKYNVLEMETNRDHVHMLVKAKDKKELSAIVRTLKCVSAKELHATPRFSLASLGILRGILSNGEGRVGNMQGGYHRRKPVEGQRSFWAARYGSREIDENEIEYMREYIRSQKKIHDTSLCPQAEGN